jgi:predicted DNA-binding protein
MRSRASVARVLAWGRVHVLPEVIPVVEREARRRGMANSGLLAEIIETWALGGGKRDPGVSVCRVHGCGRPVSSKGLCRSHYLHTRQGKPLRPIRERVAEQVIMGSLRLPMPLYEQLRGNAELAGLPVTEALRRAVGSALEEATALAAVAPAKPSARTFRMGQLRLPASVAQRLNVVAQELGMPVSEIIRRALVLRLPGKL